MKKKNTGFTVKYKFLCEFICAGAVALMLYYYPISPKYATFVKIPLFKYPVDFFLIYYAFVIAVIIGSSNAVNLTDGLDGLAIGTLIFSILSMTLVVYLVGHKGFSQYLNLINVPGASELVVFCAAMLGASLGFLWYNAYPAQVFMGDIGSLSLGGALGTVAVLVKQEFLLILIGGIFVVEALSVIIQVFSFKVYGKRVFAMAPLHHHFELKGWAEPKIVVRFWIIAIAVAVASLSLLKLR